MVTVRTEGGCSGLPRNAVLALQKQSPGGSGQRQQMACRRGEGVDEEESDGRLKERAGERGEEMEIAG